MTEKENQNNNTTFCITISKKEFEKIRDNKQFQLILRLARILNSMRFSWSSTVNLGGKDTPAAKRNSNASFLYMCALLYESFQNVYPKLNEEFRHFESFKSGLQKLKNDSIRKQYHNTILKEARRKVVFHFDPYVIQKSLERYIVNSDKVIFGASNSMQTLDMDYPLADELTYHFLMETSQIDDVSAKRFKELLGKVADLSIEFIKSSECLIADVLINLGWKFEEMKVNP